LVTAILVAFMLVPLAAYLAWTLWYMAADDAAVLSGRPLSDRDAASALAEELDCIYVEKEDFYLMRCADEPQFGATPIPRRLWKRLVELRKLGDVKEMR
jgi:hypothetical protein